MSRATYNPVAYSTMATTVQNLGFSQASFEIEHSRFPAGTDEDDQMIELAFRSRLDQMTKFGGQRLAGGKARLWIAGGKLVQRSGGEAEFRERHFLRAEIPVHGSGSSEVEKRQSNRTSTAGVKITFTVHSGVSKVVLFKNNVRSRGGSHDESITIDLVMRPARLMAIHGRSTYPLNCDVTYRDGRRQLILRSRDGDLPDIVYTILGLPRDTKSIAITLPDTTIITAPLHQLSHEDLLTLGSLIAVRGHQENGHVFPDERKGIHHKLLFGARSLLPKPA